MSSTKNHGDKGVRSYHEYGDDTKDDGSTLRTASSSTSTSSPASSVSLNSGLKELEESGEYGFKTPQKEPLSENYYTGTSSVSQVEKIPYVHGSYAGSSPIFIQDRKWMMILKHLMPEQHSILSNYLRHSEGKIDALKVMKWAENNPIIAAFGIAHSKTKPIQIEHVEYTPFLKGTNDIRMDVANSKLSSLTQKIIKKHRKRKIKGETYNHPALEWDVFLDPIIVHQVDASIQKLESLQKEKHRDTYEVEVDVANVEIDRQVSRLLNRMMLAHGSTAQLLIEAVGVATKYNFDRVAKTTKEIQQKLRKKQKSSIFNCGNDTIIDDDVTRVRSDSTSRKKSTAEFKTSAIFVNRWLRLFASAIKLGQKSIKDVEFEIERLKIRPEKLQRTRSRASQFLRGSLSSLSLDAESVAQTQTSNAADDESVNESMSFCGLFLCLGSKENARAFVDHDSTMAESIELIRNLLGEKLRVVLDLKSRHIPARVWGRLIDNLRSRGLCVDGIGSFDIDECRQIEKTTTTPVTSILFFHSAGDLQRACHANEIKANDTVYFNAGSLLKRKKTVCDTPGCFSASKYQGLEQIAADDSDKSALNYLSFQPYAYPKDSVDDDFDIVQCKATLMDYQSHFNLKIGLYVQEFSIGADELDKLVRLVNLYPNLYQCGLAWGGINGIALKGVKGDGYWSQRYVGRSWSLSSYPSRKMKLIAPEDHHAVQKAIMYGACGQVTTVNHDLDLEEEHNLICQKNHDLVGFTQTGDLSDLYD